MSHVGTDETYAGAVSMSPRRAWEDDTAGGGQGDLATDAAGALSVLNNPNAQVNQMLMTQRRRQELIAQLEVEREERRSKAGETGTSVAGSARAQPGADSLRQSAHQQRENVLRMLDARRSARQRQGSDDSEVPSAVNGIMSPPESNMSDGELHGQRRDSRSTDEYPWDEDRRDRSGGMGMHVVNAIAGTNNDQPAAARSHRRKQRAQSAPRERSLSRRGSEVKGTSNESSSAAPRAARLSAHTPSRHSKEAVMERVRRQSVVELTFKPDLIAQYKGDKHYDRYHSGCDTRTIDRLSRPRTDFYVRMSEKKAELQEREVKDLTFKPRTLEKAKRPASPVVSRSSLPVEERLFYGTERRFLIREKAKRAMEEAEVAQYSFKPCISKAARKKSGEYRPLSERIGELQRQKNESLIKLRMSTEFDNPDITFHPQLNEKSKRIADAMGVEIMSTSGMSTADRLSSGVSLASDRKRAKDDQMTYETYKDCTFQPQINPTSEMLVEDGELSFLERQERHIAQREQRLMRRMEENTHEFTFTPVVTKSSAKILEKSRHRARGRETVMERVERMSRHESKLQENKKDNIKDEYYNQFSYKPSVNRVSDKLAHSTPLSELVQNQKHKMKMEKVREKVERETMRECTFKPKIDRRSRSMTPPASRRIMVSEPDTITDRVRERKLEKEAAIREMRCSREFEELRDCSFKPNINRRIIQAKGPVVVRGLVRHLEVQQSAIRKAEEKKMREDKAFYRNVSKAPVCYTVPEPFELTKTNKSERLEKVKKDAEKAEMRECTFRPMTNAGKSKALLDKLLHD